MRWLRGVKAHYSDDRATIYHGDCIEVMRSLPDNSVDSVVTDPPYELSFMGKGWDASGIAYNPEVWRNVLRVLKPGGHLLAFGGTRTWHRLAVGIEDAGFEIRDSIAWMYGSGFPKSLDVGKAIDKRQGVEREVVGIATSWNRPDSKDGDTARMNVSPAEYNLTAPATPEAQKWAGWGTALKPAHEPIVVARKPLIGTVAENVLTHGTGALNIDGSRIGYQSGEVDFTTEQKQSTTATVNFGITKPGDVVQMFKPGGRWPANVILDESQAAELDRQSGDVKGMSSQNGNGHVSQGMFGSVGNIPAGHREGHNDSGGASRFFYVAKANKSERPRDGDTAHPTVKPLTLMRYLCKLVTPPGGTILEPFAGSGTTVQAALMEGFNVIGIEMTDEYLPLIVERIERYGEMLF